MKPFYVFRAPDKQTWRYYPKGRKRYRVRLWVKLPISKELLQQDIRPKVACTVADLMEIINNSANELMDQLRNELFNQWALFLLSVTDKTTDEEIDTFYDNFPNSEYGIECYEWS